LRVGVSPAIDSPAPLPARLASSTEDEKFSNRPVLSVKEFIFEKDPVTEPERMACLAYYLTHYKETPYFKTVDLTRLNTEAAQKTFSNPAVASNNAIRDGFFVSAPKAGYKQLSAMAERYVHALPVMNSWPLWHALHRVAPVWLIQFLHPTQSTNQNLS
jgi:hypothetical protein